MTTFGSMEHCYCLPMKLQEGSVFTGVRLSTGEGGHAW